MEYIQRRNQRTVEQTINQDGGIRSPLDGKVYTTKYAYEDHAKARGVKMVGNDFNGKAREMKDKL